VEFEDDDIEEPVYLSLDSAVPVEGEPEIVGYLTNDPKKLFALDSKALQLKTFAEGNELIENMMFRVLGCPAKDVQVFCMEKKPELIIFDRVAKLEYVCKYAIFN
jgi:hypothetical protein